MDSEKVSENIINNANADTVLECRLKSNGELSWRVPNDIKQASFMLQVLSVAVSQMLKISLQVKQPSIIQPKNQIYKVKH